MRRWSSGHPPSRSSCSSPGLSCLLLRGAWVSSVLEQCTADVGYAVSAVARASSRRPIHRAQVASSAGLSIGLVAKSSQPA
jgi:hypothetical protein